MIITFYVRLVDNVSMKDNNLSLLLSSSFLLGLLLVANSSWILLVSQNSTAMIHS
jgi:hypothetical protein